MSSDSDWGEMDLASCPKKLMITGVSGLVGGVLYRHFAARPGRYQVYGLSRRRAASERVAEDGAVEIPADRFVLSDLQDLDMLVESLQGVDVVVHMAADPRVDAPWESTLASNIQGTYCVLEACRQAGVRRTIFGSSVVTSWGYHSEEPYRAIRECRFGDVPEEIPKITHLDPPRPTEAYSASKVWGESMARMYAEVHGLSCICLRIGWVNPEDEPWQADLAAGWCSHRDIAQMVGRCVEAPETLRFDIFYGVSDNRYRWVDIEHAREVVGYEPLDNAEDYLSQPKSATDS